MRDMPQLLIREYTDPACPFAFSAEPARRRLEWLYGDVLRTEVRMVGLAERGEEYMREGLTPERQAESFRRLSAQYGMPMDARVRPRMAATVPACRAVVAVRRHDPGRERAILRALRVLHFSGWLLDDAETLSLAARRAGVDPEALEAWMAEPETEALLREDLAEARQPSPAALALSHKLASTPEGGYRYTCPSYEITNEERGLTLSVPGFQDVAAYEVAVANLLPGAERRGDPESVQEVLEWAGEPLGSAEVAAVCGIEVARARKRLAEVSHEEPVGNDGFWSFEAA